MNIELDVVVDVELEVIWLAAQGGRLLVWSSPEHVGRIRETVEENLSVIANAIRRARDGRQLDCDLVDLIYILDEPTVGLHPRDIDHPPCATTATRW